MRRRPSFRLTDSGWLMPPMNQAVPRSTCSGSMVLEENAKSPRREGRTRCGRMLEINFSSSRKIR
jgi:hypothetical protein